MAQQADPTSVVIENYLAWKGTPADMARPPEPIEHLSPSFRILQYDGDAYRVLGTAGASYQLIPHSRRRFRDDRGVRYEYLLHAPPDRTGEARELLLMVAAYPFLQDWMPYAGAVIPISGSVIPGSSLEYVYFTYPYEDDPRVFDDDPAGQIATPEWLIQTLWIFPIARSEAAYVQQAGPDAFERLAGEANFQAHDWFRSPLA